MNGSLALVGSGEYLPAMAKFEKSLVHDGVKNGKEARYVQIPTAAGRESTDRLEYWKLLGLTQAKAIGVEATYLPIYTREDAFNQKYVDAVANSALMYMSGGDPHHLAAGHPWLSLTHPQVSLVSQSSLAEPLTSKL